MLRFLHRVLHWLMMLGAPLVLPLAFAIRALDFEIPNAVAGYLCILSGIFIFSCLFIGIWTLIW